MSYLVTALASGRVEMREGAQPVTSKGLGLIWPRGRRGRETYRLESEPVWFVLGGQNLSPELTLGCSKVGLSLVSLVVAPSALPLAYLLSTYCVLATKFLT